MLNNAFNPLDIFHVQILKVRLSLSLFLSHMEARTRVPVCVGDRYDLCLSVDYNQSMICVPQSLLAL